MGFEPTTSTLAKSVRSRHKRTNLDLFAGRAGPRGYRRERAGTREESTGKAALGETLALRYDASMKRTSPEIEAAAAMGVDVAMLLGNLELTPAERVRRNGEAIQMLERIRRANFDERQREVLAELEREQLRANWGDWLAPLDAL